MTKPVCIYTSYDGLLDPLGQSQILPYILSLCGDYDFIILSFEKSDRSSTQIACLRSFLLQKGIRWTPLVFKFERFGYIKRIVRGAVLLKKLSFKYKPSFIHTRTLLPASMVFLAGIKIPLIYDIRAFAGEWIEGGRIKRWGAQALLFNLLEEYLIKTAYGLVVLDSSGADYLRASYLTYVLWLR